METTRERESSLKYSLIQLHVIYVFQIGPSRGTPHLRTVLYKGQI